MWCSSIGGRMNEPIYILGFTMTEKKYNKLMASGMMGVWFPLCKWNWEEDQHLFGIKGEG